MLVSVTSLSSYMYCPRKLFLQEVLGIREPPGKSMVLGSMRHYCFDRLNKSEQEIVTSLSSAVSYDGLLSLYEKSCSSILSSCLDHNLSRIQMFGLEPSLVYEGIWSDMHKELSSRAGNVHSFMSSTGLFSGQLWKELTPKFLSELRLESERLSLKGVVDKVELHHDFCIPHEIKSGSAARDGPWENHRIQAIAYMLLLEDALGVPAKNGVVDYRSSGIRFEIRMNPFMRSEVQNLVSDVVNMLLRRTLPKRCGSQNKCSICGIKNACFDERKLQSALKILSS